MPYTSFAPACEHAFLPLRQPTILLRYGRALHLELDYTPDFLLGHQ